MPFIDRDFINDLSNRVDIVGLINKRVALKKAGKDYKACCPFHEEKTPSFTVVPTKQIYHCFGCGESGGIIDFVMKYDHLSFVEAIETVAGESGISVVYDQTAKPVDKRFKRYNQIMSELNDFYQNQLKSSSEKNKVVIYAKKRGISGSIAKRFELGFAPPGWTKIFDQYTINEDSVHYLRTKAIIVQKKDKKDKNPDGSRLWITHEKDLANAYIASLKFIQEGNSRFDSVFIAGDPENKEHNLSKAIHLLKWIPEMNPEDYR